MGPISPHSLSQTAVLLIFLPFVSVPLAVTVSAFVVWSKDDFELFVGLGSRVLRGSWRRKASPSAFSTMRLQTRKKGELGNSPLGRIKLMLSGFSCSDSMCG